VPSSSTASVISPSQTLLVLGCSEWKILSSNRWQCWQQKPLRRDTPQQLVIVFVFYSVTHDRDRWPGKHHVLVARQLCVTYAHRIVISFYQDITISCHVTEMNCESFKVKVLNAAAGVCFKEEGFFGLNFRFNIWYLYRHWPF
jgi:hypothetical protein